MRDDEEYISVQVNLGWSMSRELFTDNDFKGATPIELKRGVCMVYEGDVREQYAYFILMGAQERTASVYTAERTHLLRISPVLWKKCMQDVDFLRRVHEMQLQRYLETTKAASRLGQSTVLHRLGTYFMTLPDWHNCQETSIQVVLPSHGQLGRMLNCTRERITVVMQKFYQSGAVKKEADGSSIISRVHLASLLS